MRLQVHLQRHEEPYSSIQPCRRLIDLTYTPNLDLNRNNVAGGGPILDSFLFTVQDDGVLLSVNPDGTPGPALPGPFTRLSATATATIDVAPQNDNPA